MKWRRHCGGGAQLSLLWPLTARVLRSNLSEQAPATLWEYYIQLTEVEEAFKNLKGDLGVRPIFHQQLL